MKPLTPTMKRVLIDALNTPNYALHGVQSRTIQALDDRGLIKAWGNAGTSVLSANGVSMAQSLADGSAWEVEVTIPAAAPVKSRKLSKAQRTALEQAADNGQPAGTTIQHVLATLRGWGELNQDNRITAAGLAVIGRTVPVSLIDQAEAAAAVESVPAPLPADTTAGRAAQLNLASEYRRFLTGRKETPATALALAHAHATLGQPGAMADRTDEQSDFTYDLPFNVYGEPASRNVRATPYNGDIMITDTVNGVTRELCSVARYMTGQLARRAIVVLRERVHKAWTAIHIGTFRESCASHGCAGCPTTTAIPAPVPPLEIPTTPTKPSPLMFPRTMSQVTSGMIVTRVGRDGFTRTGLTR